MGTGSHGFLALLFFAWCGDDPQGNPLLHSTLPNQAIRF